MLVNPLEQLWLDAIRDRSCNRKVINDLHMYYRCAQPISWHSHNRFVLLSLDAISAMEKSTLKR